MGDSDARHPASRPRGDDPHERPHGRDASKRDSYDPTLRLLLRCLRDGDWRQAAWRAGIVRRHGVPGLSPPQRLPVFLELVAKADTRKDPGELNKRLREQHVEVAPPHYAEYARGAAPGRLLPASILLDGDDPNHVPPLRAGDPVTVTLLARLEQILGTGYVARIVLSGRHGPCLVAVRHGEVGLPPARDYAATGGPSVRLTGKGVVVGIVDDGMPFAHPDFLQRSGPKKKPRFASRVAKLWDQSHDPTAADIAAGWHIPTHKKGIGEPYGREIEGHAIDKVIALPGHVNAAGAIEMDKVYRYLDYPPGALGERASHGARVAGLAAANGGGIFGCEGVAPEAELVFVQLPRDLLPTPAALGKHIADAVGYVFDYATAKGARAVVNVSYGGYSGGHDGSSAAERLFDDLLVLDDRALVVSAGNGFAADCHATATLASGASAAFHWYLAANDPTPNDLELWSAGDAALTLTLTEPGGRVHGPFPPGTGGDLATGNGAVFGRVEYEHEAGGDHRLIVWLGPTEDDGAYPNTVTAPAGRWTVAFAYAGSGSARVDAWIQRDDLGPAPARRQQSHFDTAEAHPGITLGDLATGRSTVSVGAWNDATNEVPGYSAAGPTRPGNAGPSRPRPDVLAPAAANALGAGRLATATTVGVPLRLGGTSASAPQVAGAIALAFQYARVVKTHVPAAALLAALRGGANAQGLVPERRQAVEPAPVVRQSDVFADVTGPGRLDLLATLRKLFP